MLRKFRFRGFKVYQDATAFRREVIILVEEHFPKREFVLRDQILRAVTSIVLNIAEGADRGTDKDFALFLNHSHTSLNEVVACLDLALQDGFINRKLHEGYLLKAELLANQLTAFRKSLTNKPLK